jgi:hypothetical protein
MQNTSNGPLVDCRHNTDTSDFAVRAILQEIPYFIGERAGIRTLDPVIKSHVLYQLSYALPSRIRYLKASGFTSLARLFVPLLLD